MYTQADTSSPLPNYPTNYDTEYSQDISDFAARASDHLLGLVVLAEAALRELVVQAAAQVHRPPADVFHLVVAGKSAS